VTVQAADAPKRPRARRSVLLVATATLLGFLAVEAAVVLVLPGQEYAAAAGLNEGAAARAGHVGGLLPVGIVRGRQHGKAVRDLRPAVILLVQYPCECAGRVKHVAAQADGEKVRVYLVGFHGRTQVDRLAEASGRNVVPLVDDANALSRAYDTGSDATLLLVRRDGVVTQIVDDLPAQIDLRKRLPALLESR
jgi:hypothetical protein